MIRLPKVPLLALAVILCHASLTSHGQEPTRPEVRPSTNASESQRALIDQLLEQCREHFKNGRDDEVIKTAQDALRLSRQSNNTDSAARALFQIGTAYYHLDDTAQAVENWKASVVLAGEAGNLNLQTAALKTLGVALGNIGRYDEALSFLTNSLVIARKLPDRKPLAAALMTLGWLYTLQGDYDPAESWLRQALKLAQEMKDEKYLDGPLVTLGQLELARGRYQAALGYFQQKLALEPKLEGKVLRSSRAPFREDIATTYSLMGNYEKADEVFQQALEMARAEKLSEVTIMTGLGLNAYKRNRLSEALDWLTRAQTLVKQVDDETERQWRISLGLGRVQKAMGHKDEALISYRKAIDVIELIRRRAIPSEPSRASVLSSRREVFTDTVDLLSELKQDAGALEVAEQYHARTFLDRLVESKVDLRQDVSKELRQREDLLLARISAIQRELWQANLPASRTEALTNDLSTVENDLDLFQLELRRTNPRYESLRYFKPLKLDRIQRELLDKDTAMIEYMLGEKQSFAWVVSDKKLTMVTLPPRKEIEERVEAFRQVLTERTSAFTVGPALNRFQDLSRQIYDLLVRPVETSLSSSQHLIIVPDGVLAYVPFETLLKGIKRPASAGAKPVYGEYMLERFAITYTPSASSLAAIKARDDAKDSRPKSLIAFGDPTYRQDSGAEERSAAHPIPPSPVWRLYAERGFDLQPLPYTRREVVGIGSLFPAADRQVYVGAEAREQRVKTEKLEKYGFIHFAAHGWVDEQRPMRSGIVLSFDNSAQEDGVLQVGEIMRLELNADLVTLSACRTGLGKLVGGEGVLGLTRAFFYAGASSVTVSLWNVNDLATAELMNGFYRNLRRGLPKDEALRRAKIAVIKSQHPSWQHPYFWAPFILVGERK